MSETVEKFLSSGENKEAVISFFVKEWQGQKYAKKLGAKQLFVTEGENCIKFSNGEGSIVVQNIQDLKSTVHKKKQIHACFFMPPTHVMKDFLLS